MDAHALVRKVLRVIAEENRLISASELGLGDQAHALLLETMTNSKYGQSFVTGVTITKDEEGKPKYAFAKDPKLTEEGDEMYKISKLMF
jgi:hypothetical protein